MTIMNWRPELDTGIHEIDVQHKRIVDFINAIYVAKEEQDREHLGEVIGDTVDYTLSHFAFEEALMEQAGYPYLAPHKRIHEIFTRKVGELKMRFDAGEDVADELHAMLSRWLFNHIKNDDGSYVDSVKQHQKVQANPKDYLRSQIHNEVMAALEEKQKKKGWLARLFGA